MAKYRFCFLLSTAVGNKTRFANLQRFTILDSDVESTWVPLSGYPPHQVAAKLSFLPLVWVSRLWTARQLLPILVHLWRYDAVMVHQFEAETMLVLAGYLRKRPLVISSTDDAPVVDESTYPLYDYQTVKSQRRRRFRLKMDLWRTRRIDYFIPFTRWTAAIFERQCGVPAALVQPIHVGLDISLWQRSSRRQAEPTQKVKLLFVGGEFVRKGGDLLLRIFQETFSDNAELHLVSGQAPATHHRNIFVHSGLAPNSPALIQLYGDCHVLVLPTTIDLVPWTYIEAMAMELPCIGTSVGAIDEVIEDGVTGLIVPPADGPALRKALGLLIGDAEMRLRMGVAGRAKAEREFDAAKNVPRILATMKSLVDARRGAAQL